MFSCPEGEGNTERRCLLRIREETQHYRSTLQPPIKPNLVYLQCQSAQWLKLNFFFFFALMEINPKQINFPQAPHPGSQLPWISSVVACSEIKVTRRQGQIKDTQFKATSSSPKVLLGHLGHIYFSHMLDGDTELWLLFRLRNGPRKQQKSEVRPTPTPISSFSLSR